MAIVTIDTTSTFIGKYILKLESFDSSASATQATLKADEVSIYVTDFVHFIEVQSSISIVAGNQGYLIIDHIQSLINLPTVQKINMRQKSGSELPFVTLTNLDTSTDLSIDGTGVLPGEYTLFLESFDESSAFPYLTLKEDTVTIVVT